MPLTKSAKKALLTDRRRKVENDLTRAKVKSAIKGAKIAIREENTEAINELMAKAYRELDIAAKKNVIHRNKAARLKSRLSKKISGMGVPAAAPKKAKSTAAKPAKAKTTTKKTSKKK